MTASSAGTPFAARNVDTTGLSAPVTAAASARAYAAPGTAIGGTNTAINASTPSSCTAWASAPANISGEAAAPTSTGDPDSVSPWASAASAASTPSALEFATMATRSPGGSGWCASSSAVSHRSASESTRITPACSNRAATLDSSTRTEVAASPLGSAPPCRPDFTATIGLVRASRLASRANLRGLPKDSR